MCTAIKNNWISVDNMMPDSAEPVVFTNNIEARTAQGHMSHVWLGHLKRKEDGEVKGTTEGFMKIDGVTHWLKIPMTGGKRE